MGCKQCNKKVSDSDRIVCRGFCESTFHMICVKVDVPALDVMGTHPNNFFWMCDECSKLAISLNLHRRLPRSTKKSKRNQLLRLTGLPLAKSDSGTRARTHQEKQTFRPHPVEKAMTSVPIIADAEPDDLWYIWLSSFPPTVTEDDICTMVKECLSVDEDDPVVVKMLVKKVRDYRDSSLDADNWPAGLAFREFIDFTRRPSVTTAGFAKRRTD
ncbi:hypothetical protein quinque_008753 [Culex quinquefasciatus]